MPGRVAPQFDCREEEGPEHDDDVQLRQRVEDIFGQGIWLGRVTTNRHTDQREPDHRAEHDGNGPDLSMQVHAPFCGKGCLCDEREQPRGHQHAVDMRHGGDWTSSREKLSKVRAEAESRYDQEPEAHCDEEEPASLNSVALPKRWRRDGFELFFRARHGPLRCTSIEYATARKALSGRSQLR